MGATDPPIDTPPLNVAEMLRQDDGGSDFDIDFPEVDLHSRAPEL